MGIITFRTAGRLLRQAARQKRVPEAAQGLLQELQAVVEVRGLLQGQQGPGVRQARHSRWLREASVPAHSSECVSNANQYTNDLRIRVIQD